MVFLLLPACAPGLSTELLGELQHQHGTVESSAQGTAKVAVRVDEGFTALQLVADAPPPYRVHVRSLEAPGRTPAFASADWNHQPRSKTNAGFVSPVVTLDWPVSPGDGPLSPGVWRFELGVVDEDDGYVEQPVAVDVLLKPDRDFAVGGLAVNLVYTDGLDADPELRAAVRRAEVLWAEMYADIGIDVTFEPFAYEADGLGPPAFADEERYEDLAAQTRLRAVNLVLSPSIDGFDTIYGIAGDIPGPLVPTRRSAVQVSVTSAAGRDLRFTDLELQLFAETMAHETLHFLGLFHPVEATWAAWDVLPDTAECDGEAACVDALGDNLMFPFPVCYGATCLPQDAVTADQAAVVGRAVAVD